MLERFRREARAASVLNHPHIAVIYEMYLQGTHQARTWTEAGIRKAVELFQQAIALDPSYALSYAGLSYALCMMGFYGFIPGKEAFPKGKAAAEKALQLDASLAEPRVSLGIYFSQYLYDAPQSIREFKRAIELSPNLAIAHHAFGVALNISRRSEEALAEMRKAVNTRPLGPSLSSARGLGSALYGS